MAVSSTTGDKGVPVLKAAPCVYEIPKELALASRNEFGEEYQVYYAKGKYLNNSSTYTSGDLTESRLVLIL